MNVTLLLICSFYAEFYPRKQNRYKSRDTNSRKKNVMLPLKIFWLDMDKFPGDAVKIIDQSEPFLLWWGGGGGGRVRTFQSCKNMNC